MTINLYYCQENDTSWEEEREVVFKSYSEFREWYRNNIEYNRVMVIYEGQPIRFEIHVGNLEIGKRFEHDMTWNELKATINEMSLFFHIEQDEIEENY